MVGGLIEFKGQMLLKGISDSVKITVVECDESSALLKLARSAYDDKVKQEKDQLKPENSKLHTEKSAVAAVEEAQRKKPMQANNERNHLETRQLLFDIYRLGTNGVPFCTFGELFDDENVQSFYEAINGTLKGTRASK